MTIPALPSDVVNPLIPDGVVGWHAAIIAFLVLLPIAALVSLIVSRRHLSTVLVVVWVAIIVIAPVLGPLAWFAFGIWFHRSRPEGAH